MLLDQVDPVVHFGNSASEKHEATLETDILCGIAPPWSSCIPLAPPWSSCIPLSQYKSQAVCCRERLRVIVFDNTAIVSSERALNCTHTLCFDEVFQVFLYGAILG